MQDVVVALLLLLVANGAPILVTRALGDRLDRPLDGGRRLADGRFLLGPHKTIRGLVAALLATTAAAPVLGVPALLGTAVGAAAMAGDACSSFLKRRRGLGAGDRAGDLDQLPEALLPLLTLAAAGRLDAVEVVVATAAFVVVGAVLSRGLYALGIRERPY